MANAAVDCDECCMRCGYNLRTLTVSGDCPECATPVAKSLAFSRNAVADDFRRFESATKMLVAVGVLLGLEYLNGLARGYTLYRLFHAVPASMLDELRTFLFERALHIALGVLVLVATIRLVKLFRARYQASSLTAMVCLVTAALYLLLYVAVDSHEWVRGLLPSRTILDFDYHWNNWCYAGVSCCQWLLTLGAALALEKYARERKSNALQVTSALYALLVTPVLLAWMINVPISPSAVQALKDRYFRNPWYVYIADDAFGFYSAWEWVLAVATILFWMNVYMIVKNQGLRRTLKGIAQAVIRTPRVVTKVLLTRV